MGLGMEEAIYKLKKVNFILDNIYGQIGLTEVEDAIERLPIFKRLHNISQLGLVNWIYPCALHTRYTHSIGVMHVAGLMATHINNNRPGFFDDSDIQIIRLAGLLHDIGHYPMSHNIESAYIASKYVCGAADRIKIDPLSTYINCPPFLNPMNVTQETECINPKMIGSRGLHHENISALIVENNEAIREIVRDKFVLIGGEKNQKFEKDNDSPDKIAMKLMKMIGSIIRGNYSYQPTCDWDEKYSAIIQIIHSDLDADNIDYLLRDATFSGTSYGEMDMSLLLNYLFVSEIKQKAKPKSEKKYYIVGVKRKGIGAVDQFFINKFMAYTQMIQSKYVSILEAMLSFIETYHFIPDDKIFEASGFEGKFYEEINKDFGLKYLFFTDSYLHNQIINERLSNEFKDLPSLKKSIISNLTEYSAYNLDSGESECICIGYSGNEIKETMENDSLYKEFCEEIERIIPDNSKELSLDDEKIKEIFKFRFETFKITKQLPFDVYVKKIPEDKDNNEETRAKMFNIMRYRLSNGVPVLDKECYEIDCSDWNSIRDTIPLLCVDYPQSVLHKIYSMRFVALRKYKID